eukprot:5172285-Pyramimonas_sp.AAC.1
MKRVRGVPNGYGGRLRTQPLGQSVELPRGPPACEGHANIGAVGACERTRWGRRWSSLRVHESYEGCARLNAVSACERNH